MDISDSILVTATRHVNFTKIYVEEQLKFSSIVQNELEYRNFFKRVLNVVLLADAFFMKGGNFVCILIPILVRPL